MTNQIQGELLYAGASDICTPWMPVRGDNGSFGVEVIENNSTTVSWDVETRTLEDTTATSILDATGSFSSGTTGLEVLQNGSTKPAKELVRYKISVGTSYSNSEFVVLRALQPSWQNDR